MQATAATVAMAFASKVVSDAALQLATATCSCLQIVCNMTDNNCNCYMQRSLLIFGHLQIEIALIFAVVAAVVAATLATIFACCLHFDDILPPKILLSCLPPLPQPHSICLLQLHPYLMCSYMLHDVLVVVLSLAKRATMLQCLEFHSFYLFPFSFMFLFIFFVVLLAFISILPFT